MWPGQQTISWSHQIIATSLHELGILYAPDYIVNAGGAIALGSMTEGESDLEVLDRKVNHIEQSLTEILTAAAKKKESPVQAAQRIVAKRLEA